MAPLRFDRARILAFLELAGDRLDGEWLLVGGGAAAAWFAVARTTEDLDLVGLVGSQQERFAMMELAREASLPIEAVNSAADFFVNRIDDWREHLVVLHRGATATIYRPDATLFLLLKVGRLSDVDLQDCLALLDHCAVDPEPIDRVRVRARLEALIAATDEHELNDRQHRLLARLWVEADLPG